MAVAVRSRRPRRRAQATAPQRLRDSWTHRAGDIIGATLLLLLTAPVLLLGIMAVGIGSGRPIFFGHVRVGRDGRTFRCWKLRTMHVDAERALAQQPQLRERYVANGYKLPGNRDPRITRVGRLLRRTYVDELPQLINVLQGTMSLVGPRPIIREELEQFGSFRDELLRVRPGIVGAWTSRGRARPPYPERARIELQYVRNRSLRGDVDLLLRTIPVILRGQPEDA